jgi:hypothetical protein
MKVAAIVIMSTVLAGVAFAEERNDKEPLEHKRRLAPMRELRSAPERGSLSSSHRDDSADWKDDDPSDRSDGRGGRSNKDDDD